VLLQCVASLLRPLVHSEPAHDLFAPLAACEVWKHTTCYGFDGAEDSRIPDTFICYRCLAHTALDDAAYEPDKVGEIEQALAEFRSLALFRRGASRLSRLARRSTALTNGLCSCLHRLGRGRAHDAAARQASRCARASPSP